MDRALKARLEAPFADQLTGPIRQRHDETEIRVGAGRRAPVLTALTTSPTSVSSSWRTLPASTPAP